jgi:hypothetical protein
MCNVVLSALREIAVARICHSADGHTHIPYNMSFFRFSVVLGIVGLEKVLTTKVKPSMVL